MKVVMTRVTGGVSNATDEVDADVAHVDEEAIVVRHVFRVRNHETKKDCLRQLREDLSEVEVVVPCAVVATSSSCTPGIDPSRSHQIQHYCCIVVTQQSADWEMAGVVEGSVPRLEVRCRTD